jgi:hypothetical protein
VRKRQRVEKAERLINFFVDDAVPATSMNRPWRGEGGRGADILSIPQAIQVHRFSAANKTKQALAGQPATRSLAIKVHRDPSHLSARLPPPGLNRSHVRTRITAGLSRFWGILRAKKPVASPAGPANPPPERRWEN